MFDLVRKVLEGAERDGGILRISGGSIGFREVRQDDLRVGLGAQCAGLEQRLEELDALGVHIDSCVDVIQSIHNDILGLQERERGT